ncbi:MAG: hypothetical protein COA32_00820 [Fluviicola sp.]|nr:MAG: hypothetical protein COA32_00820 [Fluviicola sp.]
MNKSYIRKILRHSQKSEMQLLLENIDVQIEKSCLETNIDHLIKYADFEKGKYLFQVSHQTYFVKSGIYFMSSHDNSLHTVNKVIIDLYKYQTHNFRLSMSELRALIRRLKRKLDYDLIKIHGLECIYVDLNHFDSDLSRQTFIIDQIKRIACEIHAVFFIIKSEFNSNY